MLSLQFLKLLLSVFKVFASLFSELRSALEAPVVELIESHDTALVFLCEVVRKCRLSTLFRTNDHHIELVLLFDRSWILHLKAILLFLRECSFELALLLGEFLSSGRYCFQSLWWLLLG